MMRPSVRRPPADVLVHPHRFDHLGIDAQNRVQSHHRILEDHRDTVAAQLPQPCLRGPQHVLTIESDLATYHFARRIDQADD